MGVPATPPCVRIARAAELGDSVDGVELALVRQRVEGHVERDVHGLAALAAASRAMAQMRSSAASSSPSAPAASLLRHPSTMPSRPEGERDARVGLHHLDLDLVVHEVAAARGAPSPSRGRPGRARTRPWPR